MASSFRAEFRRRYRWGGSLIVEWLPIYGNTLNLSHGSRKHWTRGREQTCARRRRVHVRRPPSAQGRAGLEACSYLEARLFIGCVQPHRLL
eukprot:4713096-Prymnesium_polylepis.1